MSDNILGQTELEQMIIEKNMELASKARTPINNPMNIKGMFIVQSLLVSANKSVVFQEKISLIMSLKKS